MPFTADDFLVPTSENKVNSKKGYFGYQTLTPCELYLNLRVMAQVLFQCCHLQLATFNIYHLDNVPVDLIFEMTR